MWNAKPFDSMRIGILATMLVACLPPAGGLAQEQAAGSTSVGVVARDEIPSETIEDFYRARSDRPVWSEHGVLNQAGLRLQQAVSEADRHGIEPADLDLAEFSDLALRRTGEAAAAFDRQLTALFLRYARAVRTGRVTPDGVPMTWSLDRPSFPAGDILERLQHGDPAKVVDEQPPPFASYRALVVALARYRAIAAQGGWPAIADGPVLEAGQSGERVALLRHRLAVEGYPVEGEGGGDAFDGALDQAVRVFQARHGLAVDGRVGAETLAALNRTAADRVAQIEANMERWRWMPRQLPARRIEVNVAAAELTVFDQDRPVMTMRTIVGSPRHRTPMLQGAIQAVIVNPPWNVPVSITVNEILPRLRREPDYLLKQQIQILDRPHDPYGLEIDWRALPRGTSFRLQQKPGPLNSLGRLKFDIPNRFDVYLHDTPAKALFARTRRTLSHGCVRLQQPEALARYLLGGPAEQLVAELASGETVRLPLHQPMPVYLLYWTAFAEGDGALAFRDDVYGHDMHLLAALKGRIRQFQMSAVGGCPGPGPAGAAG